jgi:hypothetical protein
MRVKRAREGDGVNGKMQTKARGWDLYLHFSWITRN